MEMARSPQRCRFAAGSGALDLSVFDANDDGVQDLAIVDSTRVRLYLGNGNGTFAAAITLGTGTAFPIMSILGMSMGMESKISSPATNPPAKSLSTLQMEMAPLKQESLLPQPLRVTTRVSR